MEKCHKSAQMCGQHAYQAPAPRSAWALDIESKARPAAQTRKRDNKTKESQLSWVERGEKNNRSGSFSMLHLTNVPGLCVCIRACACACKGNPFSTHKSCTKRKDLKIF